MTLDKILQTIPNDMNEGCIVQGLTQVTGQIHSRRTARIWRRGALFYVTAPHQKGVWWCHLRKIFEKPACE